MLFVKYKQGLHLEKFVYEKHIVFWFFFTNLNVREYIIYQNKRKLECIANVHTLTILRDMWCLEDILCYTSGWVGEVFGGWVILVLCWDIAVRCCGVLAAAVWGDGTWNYQDTKSKMSSLQVFHRVYRLERKSVMLVFSTPLMNWADLSLSSPPPPSSRSKCAVYTTVCGCGGWGVGEGCWIVLKTILLGV